MALPLAQEGAAIPTYQFIAYQALASTIGVETVAVPVAREQRKLAAILAAEVVGYSRRMGRDESGTVSQLWDHRVRRHELLHCICEPA